MNVVPGNNNRTCEDDKTTDGQKMDIYMYCNK